MTTHARAAEAMRVITQSEGGGKVGADEPCCHLHGPPRGLCRRQRGGREWKSDDDS
jgi:hypothetical protein